MSAPTTRVFRDASHVSWSVREADAPAIRAAPAARCLVFTSAQAIRRVWRYPPDWCALDDAALEALSWQT
jgi:hypothetical protein